MFSLKKIFNPHCNEEDTRFFYLLCLGRDLQHAGELEKGLRSRPFTLVRQLLAHPTCVNDFIEPLKLGARPVYKPYSAQEEALLINGFRRHIKIKKPGTVRSWHEAMELALTSPRFLLALEESSLTVDANWLCSSLETCPPANSRALVGNLETFHNTGCRGYVLDTNSPGDSVTLDLYLNDAFVGQAKPSLLRRDLQEQYGGHGKYGFECAYTIPARLAGFDKLVLRAVDHNTGFPALDSKVFMPSKALQRTTVEQLVRKLTELGNRAKETSRAEIDDLLERIRSNLPIIEQSASLLLHTYADHHLLPPELPGVDDGADGAEPALIILGWKEGDHIAENAIHYFQKAARENPAAQLFYAGFEYMDPTNGSVFPYLRAAFDPELLLTDPNYSRFYAIRKDSIDLNATGSDMAIWLQVLRQYGEAGFCALPQIGARLSSSAPEPDTDVIQIYLMETAGKKAAAKPHKDQFAPPLSGFMRIARNADKQDAPITVIIPTRNNLDLLTPCIDSLRETADTPSALDILIVDNGSTDQELLSWLEEQQNDGLLRAHRHDAAFNWSELNNLAAGKTDAPYLLFLNDDTKSVTYGWDSILRAQLEREDIGAVGARLFYEDATLQHAGVIINSLQEVRSDAVTHDSNGETANEGGYLNRSRLCHRVSAVTGAFLACRRVDFEDLNGFDEEKFAVAFNDIDFCLRMRKKGKHILYDPSLSFFHYESKSRGYDNQSEEKRKRVRQEHEAMVARWKDEFSDDPYYPQTFLRRGKPFSTLRS